MADLTPRDDIRKRVSEILKRVDQLIRSGDIDQSVREIIHAKEIDPKNVYIRAYEERLTYLKEEHERHIEEERTRKAAEEAARKRDEEARKKREEEGKRQEEERRRAEEERRIREAEEQRRDEEERRKVEEERRKAEEHQRTLEAERRRIETETRKLEEELRKAEEDLRKREESAQKPQQARQNNFEASAEYQLALREVWADGATTADEETRLRTLRALLGISEEEHTKLEREIKLETYYAAIKRAWSAGSITPETASSLADLRKKFRITPEEHDDIEAQLLWELRAGQERPNILIIDDDTKLLTVITETLSEAGFNVKAFPSSDDAFNYLKDQRPDLIISDINLETSTMGGFTFYEKVRELDHLQEVPFIFLSGLTDEVLIRTGKELGVDDYLTKPFSDETLIATIKGKLKRFKQLKDAKKKKGV